MKLSLTRFCLLVCMISLAFSALLLCAVVCAETASANAVPDRIVVTDYPSISEAVDAARSQKIYDIYIPSGKYVIDKTLNLTSSEGEAPRQFRMQGAGPSTVLVANTGNTPAIDLTGSCRVILRDFIVQTPIDQNNAWLQGGSVGILMARVAPINGSIASSGHHAFENVIIQGNYATAAAFSYCSEENTYDHCVFINEGGDAFILTGRNEQGVTSPYQPLGKSSCVVANFYFPWFWSGKAGSVGLRISCASDINLYGGFFASYGDSFADIYLDGTAGCGNISLRDIRTEGSTGHTIYAVGSVQDVFIEGGSLQGTNAECIHHQDSVPSNDGPHRFVSLPSASGRARNWVLGGVRFNRVFKADQNLNYDYDQTKPVPEGYATLRFESLQDSRFSSLSYYINRQNTEKGSGQIVTVTPTDTPLVVVEKYSRRNTFEVPSRESVDLRGDSRGNSITSLADDLEDKVPALLMTGQPDETPGLRKYYDGGTRRTYVDADGGGSSLLNFGAVDVHKIAHPRKGDIAIHDGTGFKDRSPRLATYDGKKWVFGSAMK